MDLSFAEQVKILLKRRNMTISELADSIEETTGMKMTRQNLTQRLVRDNFKEQDMRMIASVLRCNLTLAVQEVSEEDFVPYVPQPRREKEDGVSFRKVVDQQLTIADVIKAAGEKVYPEGSAGSANTQEARERGKRRLKEEEALAKAAREKAAGESRHEEKEQTEEDREQAKEIARRALEATHTEAEFRRFGVTGRVDARTKGEASPKEATGGTDGLPDGQTPQAAAAAEAPAGVSQALTDKPSAPSAEDKEETMKQEEEKRPGAAESLSEEAAALEELTEDNRLTREEIEAILNDGNVAPKELLREETLVGAAKKDAEAKAALSNTADMGVVPDSFKRTSAGKQREGGEVNPRTGEEYESNVVRRHPQLTGYIQVYDREEHKWIDMTEWAFLGFQERKKTLLGADYQPPIYLE